MPGRGNGGTRAAASSVCSVRHFRRSASGGQPCGVQFLNVARQGRAPRQHDPHFRRGSARSAGRGTADPAEIVIAWSSDTVDCRCTAANRAGHDKERKPSRQGRGAELGQGRGVRMGVTSRSFGNRVQSLTNGFNYPPCLKNCTARSCFSAAWRVENVPRFLRRPVLASFFRE